MRIFDRLSCQLDRNTSQAADERWKVIDRSWEVHGHTRYDEVQLQAESRWLNIVSARQLLGTQETHNAAQSA